MWSLKETNLIPFDAQLRAKNNSLGVRRRGGLGWLTRWWNGVTLDNLSVPLMLLLLHLEHGGRGSDFSNLQPQHGVRSKLKPNKTKAEREGLHVE